MTKTPVPVGEIVYTTGAYLRYDPAVEGCYVVVQFEDDTFYDGDLVEDVESAPHTEKES